MVGTISQPLVSAASTKPARPTLMLRMTLSTSAPRASKRHGAEIGEIPTASGRGIEQRTGICLSRMRKDLRRWTLFHDPAVLHYGNVVADLRRDAQVMGDEQQRDTEPRLDFVEQLQHLRLYRHVQRRDGLIRHQHVGVERQRAGDRDALALAAGELMRITRDRIW